MTTHLRFASCPNKAAHEPMPDDYAAIAGWMHVKSRTHRQVQCPSCGKYLIWVPREDVRGETG